MPAAPAERQAIKVPDQGSTAANGDNTKFRRAVLAGLLTSPQGVLGSPTTSKPTLG